jgi:hypothetical protein
MWYLHQTELGYEEPMVNFVKSLHPADEYGKDAARGFVAADLRSAHTGVEGFDDDVH